MSEDSSDEATRSIVNRRTAVKSLGVGITGIAFPYGTVTSALGAGYDGEMVIIKRPADNRMSPDEVHDVQKEAVQRFRDETGKDFGIGSAAPADGSDIISAVYRIDSTGQSLTYLGCVDRDSSVSEEQVKKLHQRAEEHAQNVADGVGDTSAPGVVRAGNASNWDRKVNNYSIDFNDCPDGGIYMGGAVYEEEGTDLWGYGIDHTHRPNPASNFCSDSSGGMTNSRSEMNWEYFDVAEPEYHEAYPDTDKNGDFSVSGTIGILSADISVTYDPPEVYRDVTLDYNNNENVWMDWDFGTIQYDAAEFDVTSCIYSAEQARSGSLESNRLLEVYANADWTSGFSEDSAYLYVE